MLGINEAVDVIQNFCFFVKNKVVEVHAVERLLEESTAFELQSFHDIVDHGLIGRCSESHYWDPGIGLAKGVETLILKQST